MELVYQANLSSDALKNPLQKYRKPQLKEESKETMKQWFSNLKIARKLAVIFSVVLALIVGLGVFAILQFARLHEPTSRLTSVSLPGVVAVTTLRGDMNTLRRLNRELALTAGTEQLRV